MHPRMKISNLRVPAEFLVSQEETIEKLHMCVSNKRIGNKSLPRGGLLSDLDKGQEFLVGSFDLGYMAADL